MDKNKAIVDYLFNCPVIAANPLYFNFSQAEDNNKQIVTIANDKAVERPYVDGSVLRRYTFTIIDYRSIIYQALVPTGNFPNENIAELLDVQSIIDWIGQQNELQVFPNFGSKCKIDEIIALTDSPRLNGVDKTVEPKLAKYSISIQVTYLDMSKVIWDY